MYVRIININTEEGKGRSVGVSERYYMWKVEENITNCESVKQIFVSIVS